jgi:Mlc titration factor MtfA (ptsG expression regulator)
MGILSWWSDRNRKSLIAGKTPDSWGRWLGRLWFFDQLSDDQQQKIIAAVKVLVAEKNWESCGGLAMSDEIRVTIAGQIGWLVVGLGPEYFDQVQSILVYPDAYRVEDKQVTSGGLVLEGDSARQGEAWYRGPVILSWDDVQAGGFSSNHGHNLVLHEFAHQLDFLNGRDADGIPPIEDSDTADRWLRVTKREFQSLVEDCALGRRTLLDCYGTTNSAEFFAVATESFFQVPSQFRQNHPELFDVLLSFYRHESQEVSFRDKS